MTYQNEKNAVVRFVFPSTAFESGLEEARQQCLLFHGLFHVALLGYSFPIVNAAILSAEIAAAGLNSKPNNMVMAVDPTDEDYLYKPLEEKEGFYIDLTVSLEPGSVAKASEHVWINGKAGPSLAALDLDLTMRIDPFIGAATHSEAGVVTLKYAKGTPTPTHENSSFSQLGRLKTDVYPVAISAISMGLVKGMHQAAYSSALKTEISCYPLILGCFKVGLTGAPQWIFNELWQ